MLPCDERVCADSISFNRGATEFTCPSWSPASKIYMVGIQVCDSGAWHEPQASGDAPIPKGELCSQAILASILGAFS